MGFLDRLLGRSKETPTAVADKDEAAAETATEPASQTREQAGEVAGGMTDEGSESNPDAPAA